MVLPTAALITESDLINAYLKFTKNNEQFHFAAKLYDISAFWAFIEVDNNVKPLHKEMLTVRSQDLPITFSDAGLFYILKSTVIKTSIDTWFNNERVGYSVIESNRAIDVDTPEDWDKLICSYQKLRFDV
jgi:N-acylneuraminate cytidylyltransferase